MFGKGNPKKFTLSKNCRGKMYNSVRGGEREDIKRDIQLKMKI